VDQSWATDVLLALIVDHAGWPLAAALAAIGLALVYAGLARGLVRDGISPVIAVVVSLLMTAMSSHHFLIRPHLFTLAMVAVGFRLCQVQHERGGWSVAGIPILTAVLANLHGGFLALPLIVLTAALGHAVSGPWDAARRRRTGSFVLAFAASCLAGLLTPYGLDLYRHVAKLLVTSGVTGLIIEYQPAPFGKPEARVLELVLLSLVALPAFTSRKLDRYQLAHLLVWLHLALGSIRHAPLLAFAAAYPMASLLDGLPWSFRVEWPDRGWNRFWIPAQAGGIVLAAVLGVPLASFDPGKWPLAALDVLDRQPPGLPLFHEQDWGGLVASETRPPRPSFVDDRFELFGREAILEYADVLTGGPAWDALRDRERIGLVWIRPDRGLARRLLNEPGWEVLHENGTSMLFGKCGGLAGGLISARTSR
jgi:hypothetical protein